MLVGICISKASMKISGNECYVLMCEDSLHVEDSLCPFISNAILYYIYLVISPNQMPKAKVTSKNKYITNTTEANFLSIQRPRK